MPDRTETLVLETEIDVESSIESIDNLTKANKELRKERNALNLQSEAGKKRAQEINHLLDDNTNKIKTNVSALEKQKINIGNYKSALDGVHPALGKVGEGLEAGTSGLKSMTVQALRFIATPIGAILAGLVAVFTLLKTALSTNSGLMDEFENITHAVGVVVEVITSRIGKLGEALVALAKGNFSEAIDLTGQAFSGLADEIANAVKQQQLFLDGSRKLQDDTRALNIQIAKNENEIKRLITASRDRNKSLDEQEKLLRDALALEEETVKIKEDLARRDLVITARQLRSAKEFQQQDNENFDQYIQRLLNSSKLGGEEKDKITEKILAQENARGSSLAFQEKVENSLSAIAEKRAAALEKLNAQLAEQAANERAIRRAQNILPETPTEDPLVNAFQTQVDLIDNIDERMKKDLEKRNAEFNAKRLASARTTAEELANIQQQEFIAVAGFLGAVSGLLDRQSDEYKAVATFQAVISTYATAQKAFEAAYTPPTVASPALAGLYVASAIATGLANVARINGIEFAEGGLVLRGKSHAQGGIPIVAEGNEIIMTKGVYQNPELRRAASAINVAGGGRSFADGGIVTSAISQPINQAFDIQNILKNLPPIEVGVKEITRVQNRIKTKEKISKR